MVNGHSPQAWGGQFDIHPHVRHLSGGSIRTSECSADFLILSFIQGGCQVVMDGTAYKCASGDVALLQKNEVYQVRPEEDHAQVALIELSAQHVAWLKSRGCQAAGRMVELVSRSIVLHLSDEERERISPLLNVYLLGYSGEDAYAGCYRTSALELAMIELCRLVESRESLQERVEYSETECSRLIKSVIAYINEHYQEEIHLDTIARKFWVSPSYLSRQFKSKVGVNITRFITERRIQVAQRLLITSDLNITEIALQLGFKNANYFNAVFKKVQGISPREYRKHKRINGDLLGGHAERKG